MLPAGLYSQAHLIVAALRVREHLDRRPPDLNELAMMLGASVEELALLLRKLEDLGIVAAVKSGAGERFVPANHLAIEDLSREADAPGIAAELKDFKSRQQNRLSEIDELMKKPAAKPDLFKELDRALKDPSSLPKKKNPLD